MMSVPVIEAAISFSGGEMRQVLRGDGSDGFGLLERSDEGWKICIPDGARAECGGEPVDLQALRLEPSGERHLPYAFGRSASIDMAEFRFELRAAC